MFPKKLGCNTAVETFSMAKIQFVFAKTFYQVNDIELYRWYKVALSAQPEAQM